MGMYHSGLGGGGFLLVRDANGNHESLDYRESAPAAAFEEMYRGNFIGSLIGGLAAGVPGELRGLDHLHKKYGVRYPHLGRRVYSKLVIGPPMEECCRPCCSGGQTRLHR